MNHKESFNFDIRDISDSPYSFKAVVELTAKNFSEEATTLAESSIIEGSLESLGSAFGTKTKLMKVRHSQFFGPVEVDTAILINVEQKDPYSWHFVWSDSERNEVLVVLDLDIATDFSVGC